MFYQSLPTDGRMLPLLLNTTTLAQWNIEDRSQVYTDVAVPDWIRSLVVEQHWLSNKS